LLTPTNNEYLHTTAKHDRTTPTPKQEGSYHKAAFSIQTTTYVSLGKEMKVTDFATVLETDEYGIQILEFQGTAHLIEKVDEDGEIDYDSGEYWIQGVDGESEQELFSYVNSLPKGVYHVHTYKSMVTDYSPEEDTLLWNVYDSTGTSCDVVTVK
jgi:hypothetical protein